MTQNKIVSTLKKIQYNGDKKDAIIDTLLNDPAKLSSAKIQAMLLVSDFYRIDNDRYVERLAFCQSLISVDNILIDFRKSL